MSTDTPHADQIEIREGEFGQILIQLVPWIHSIGHGVISEIYSQSGSQPKNVVIRCKFEFRRLCTRLRP